MHDMKKLDRIKSLNANASEAAKAFWAFDKAAMADGAIPRKYKEMISLGVALTTQCPYCLEVHEGRAREVGVTEEEMAELILVAAAVRAGGAITFGCHVLHD